MSNDMEGGVFCFPLNHFQMVSCVTCIMFDALLTAEVRLKNLFLFCTQSMNSCAVIV